MSIVSDAGPVDAQARALIAAELGRTLFVEAGAGAGKTHELVERFVNLVASGVPVTTIAAISFTEKAAAELRDRVRTTLERRILEGDHAPAFLREALEVLDEAHIQTLHAFAQSLLAAHAVDAGLPPVFEVVDDIEAAIDFDRRWGPFLDDLLTLPEHGELMTVACTLGMTPDRLRDLAQQFHDHWDQLLDVEFPDVEQLQVPDLAPLAAALDRALAARDGCLVPGDALQRHLDEVVAPARHGLGVVGTPLAAAEVFRAMLRLAGSAGLGNKNNWRHPSKEDVLARLAAADQARLAACQELALPVLMRVCRLVGAFTLAGAEERRADGRLEFHDLLVLARALLREHADVRADVARDVSHLLVDEFQDTDPLQIELAVLIARAEGAPVGDSWWETRVEAGRLFFVGDPKQSIYRFRGADIAVYQRARERFAADLVELTYNFRSVAPVLAWVNAAFAGLFGEDEPDPGQAAWSALDHHRPAVGETTPVVILGGPAAPRTGLAAIREAEATDVAEVCRRAEGSWLVAGVGPAGQEELRPARYDDIAILLPTRTSLAAIERALDAAGVPYRIESRSLLWATQEVRDLVSILRAIDDPSDEVALIAALRSPLLACTDRDLVEWRHAGGGWNFLAPIPAGTDPDHPLVAAVTWLRAVHADRWHQTVSALADRVVRERAALELAFGRSRQRETWHRVRFFLDQARAFADRGGASLRHFVDWAERQAAEGAGAVETVVPESDDRAVRILTVHAAKGLEFPIAVVAGINTNPRRWRPAEVLWLPGGPPEISVGINARPWHTPGYQARRGEEMRMEHHEAARLLYVACTRARDHLVVSLHHKAERPAVGASLAARLLPHAEAAGHLSRRLDEDSPAPPMPPGAAPPAAPCPVPAVDLQAWRARRQALVDALGRERAISATALAAAAVGPQSAPATEVADPGADAELPPWRRGRAGSAFGRAVHAVLQSVDLATGAGLEAIAAAQAAAEGIGGRGPEVAASARAALDAPVIRQAVSGRHWREVYVAADLDGVIVDGYIDLLVERPHGLVVVDYKTDALADDQLEIAVARYRIQLAVYAVALEANLDRAVVGAELVFTRASGARQRSVPDLAGAQAEVRALVANLGLTAG